MKKAIYLLFIGCMFLTACGKSTASVTETSIETDTGTDVNIETADTAAPEQTESDASTLTGRIQSINDTTIVLATMNVPGDMGPNDTGTPPDGKAPDDSGKAPSGDKPDDSGKAPSGDKPDDSGNAPDGDMPQMKNGEVTEITLLDETQFFDESDNAIALNDLNEGDMITVTLDENNHALSISLSSMQPEMGAPDKSQGAPSSYNALLTYDSDTVINNQTCNSTGADENAIYITNGAAVDLNEISVSRNSKESSGGDSSSFYGVGASILVADGTANISKSTITSDAAGAAGIFAYGNGIANVSDTTITTMQDTSGGIHVAGGGTLHAQNLTVETSGESAAAIRSDRGGGTMTVDGGSYLSNGIGSPAVYSTADITIANADLKATGSEAVCIEGLNSLVLNNCNLTGCMPNQAQNDCTWTVILYQSMSGDSEVGNSTFKMNGGTLTAENGGLFYTTNTESTFYLSNVDISYSKSNDFFLKCTGNSNQRGWGKSGANGADCIFTADAQEMMGNILWDSISTLDFKLQNGSILTGAFLQDESCAGNGGSGYANVSIEQNSTWIVTENSILSKLTNNGIIKDVKGNTVTIKESNGTILVNGTSEYSITVDSYAAH